jgi:hypothetical protein
LLTTFLATVIVVITIFWFVVIATIFCFDGRVGSGVTAVTVPAVFLVTNFVSSSLSFPFLSDDTIVVVVVVVITFVILVWIVLGWWVRWIIRIRPRSRSTSFLTRSDTSSNVIRSDDRFCVEVEFPMMNEKVLLCFFLLFIVNKSNPTDRGICQDEGTKQRQENNEEGR